jgi:hypothetical protein
LAIRWRATDNEGNEVIRAIRVTKKPPLFPHAFEAFAAQKDRDSKDIDAVRFFFTTNWIPRHVLGYYSRDEESAELFNARWMLWKLVEYTEQNNEPGFQPGGDTYVGQYFLWLRLWSDMAYSKTTIDGAEYHSLCTNVIDTVGVTICLNLADRRIKHLRADPNALKWSLNVTNYPYQTTNSRLALKVSFDSRRVVRDLSDDTDGQEAIESSEEAALDVNDDSAGARGVASWVTEIDVQGQGCSPKGSVVRSVVYEGEVQGDVDLTVNYPNNSTDTDNVELSAVTRVVYFSFITDCQPHSILWDPEFGVVSQNGVTTLVPSIAVLLLLAFFFLL